MADAEKIKLRRRKGYGYLIFVYSARSNAAKSVFAGEKGDDGENAAVKEDLAELEVDPVVKDKDFICAEAENEGSDTGGECMGKARRDLGPLS